MADTPNVPSGVTEAFTKKVGPLPLGVWVAVIGGSLAIAYYTSRKKAASTVVDPQISTGGVPGVGVGGVQPGFIPIPPPTTDSGPVKYSDNISWASAAVAFLIGKNYPGTDATVAIQKYLSGAMWDASQNTLINEAIKGIGPPPLLPVGGGMTPNPPPTPVPPTPTPPGPTPTPTPTPVPPAPTPAPRTYTVQKWPAQGSTLFGISQIMYNGDGNKWPIIYNANRDKISNPDLIYAGTVLRIP